MDDPIDFLLTCIVRLTNSCNATHQADDATWQATITAHNEVKRSILPTDGTAISDHANKALTNLVRSHVPREEAMPAVAEAERVLRGLFWWRPISPHMIRASCPDVPEDGPIPEGWLETSREVDRRLSEYQTLIADASAVVSRLSWLASSVGLSANFPPWSDQSVPVVRRETMANRPRIAHDDTPAEAAARNRTSTNPVSQFVEVLEDMLRHFPADRALGDVVASVRGHGRQLDRTALYERYVVHARAEVRERYGSEEAERMFGFKLQDAYKLSDWLCPNDCTPHDLAYHASLIVSSVSRLRSYAAELRATGEAIARATIVPPPHAIANDTDQAGMNVRPDHLAKALDPLAREQVTKTDSESPAEANPLPRIKIDTEARTVHVDGVPHKVENAPAFHLFCTVMEARGEVVGKAKLNELPGCKGDRLDKVRNKLPTALKALIVGQAGPGGGYRLAPFPPK